MRKLIDLWKTFEDRFSMVLLCIMVILVFLSAVARAVGRPNPWSVEVAQLLFTWFTFAAASATWRRNGHVSVDIFYNRFPKKIQIVCDYISLILTAVFLGYISTYAVVLAIQNYERRLNVLPISYSWITISVAIFGYAMLLTTIFRIIRKIRGQQEILDTDVDTEQEREAQGK